jgi:hypothetical protein
MVGTTEESSVRAIFCRLQQTIDQYRKESPDIYLSLVHKYRYLNCPARLRRDIGRRHYEVATTLIRAPKAATVISDPARTRANRLAIRRKKAGKGTQAMSTYALKRGTE